MTAPEEQLEGTVVTPLPNDMFRVRLDDERVVACHLGSQYRMHYIRLVAGDRVQVALTPFDRGRGRIVGKRE